jgi:hypothetical protein
VSTGFTAISLSLSSNSGHDVVLTSSCEHGVESESDVCTSITINDSKKIQPQKELQGIINQLEEENR